jgi:hypothetical protein
MGFLDSNQLPKSFDDECNFTASLECSLEKMLEQEKHMNLMGMHMQS